MAKKNKLTRMAVAIGTAMGKADRKVQKVARAGLLAQQACLCAFSYISEVIRAI